MSIVPGARHRPPGGSRFDIRWDLLGESLEREDLSAWSDLRELEIDASPGFRPSVFERKLPKCGFCINEKDDPHAHL